MQRAEKMIKPKGVTLGRPRRRWEDDIKMNLIEIRCEVVDSIQLTQDKV
jgi:hypothetical protein